MSEHARQNPALRVSEAIKHLIGRLGLSITEDFPAVDAGEIPDRRNGVSLGVFEPPAVTEADRRRPLTRAQVEDRAAANAAMKAEGFPKGQIPSVFSQPKPHKR